MAVVSQSNRHRIVGICLLAAAALAVLVILLPSGDRGGTNWWSNAGKNSVLSSIAIVLAVVGVRLLMLAARPRRTEEPEDAADDGEATEAE